MGTIRKRLEIPRLFRETWAQPFSDLWGASSRPRPVCFSGGIPFEDPLLHFGGASLLPLTVQTSPPPPPSQRREAEPSAAFWVMGFLRHRRYFLRRPKIPATILPSFSPAPLCQAASAFSNPRVAQKDGFSRGKGEQFSLFSSPRSLHFGKRGGEQSNI